MALNTTLPPDLAQLIALFESYDVRYLLVGGHAVGLHGRVRATEDSDLFVEATKENALRVSQALKEFGFGLGIQPTLAQWCEPDWVYQMGMPPNRIDVMTSISGVAFDEAWKEQVIVDMEGLKVRVISRNHLLTNKHESGRPQDLQDYEMLMKLEEAPPKPSKKPKSAKKAASEKSKPSKKKKKKP